LKKPIEDKAIDCLGIGLAALDRIMLVERYPRSNEKTEAIDFRICGGGPVANAMVVLAELGMKTAFCGLLGEDEAGEIILQEFAEAGVDTSAVIRRKDFRTPEGYIWVDKTTAERTVVLNRRKERSLTASDLPLTMLKKCRYLLMDGRDIEANLSAGKAAHEAGGKVVYDLGSIRPRMEELIASADIIITTARFIGDYYPQASLENGLETLYQCGLEMAALTMGQYGCVWRSASGLHYTPAMQVQAIDTTGAGDVFHGAFIYGQLKGWNPQRTVEFASAAAAITCEILGGRGAVKSEKQVWARARSTKGFIPKY